MSEADSPNDQSGSPAPTEPVELIAAIDSATAEVSNPDNGEGWQTIAFPGAMSVDAIPHIHVEALGGAIEQGVIHYSGAEIAPATTYFAATPAETSEALPQLQQLQDENAALRDRLTQVEQDLVQQQIEWQLESACTLSQAETTTGEAVAPEAPVIPEPPSTFELTHDRLHQLLQELERSHQTAQRQQILVETLTEQLESSQERIAQLERDCALTQQRHNEQVQQVLQAESACRDLRLRLHRQQQQTLQFKAALEKCLEMPTVYGNQAIPDVVLDDGSADDSAAPDTLSALIKPKNEPVKPWSLPSQAEHTSASDQLELPKPLFKLLNHGLPEQGDETDSLRGSGALVAGLNTPFSGGQGSTMAAFADPSALLDSDDPQFVTHLMQLIFPDTAEHLSYTDTDALQMDGSQAETIFDLSPFLGTENANADTMPSVKSSQALISPDRSTDLLTTSLDTGANCKEQSEEVPSDASAIAIPASTLPDDRSTDPLWHDLATLIDPQLSVASTNAVATVDVDTDPDASVDPVQATPDIAGIPPIAVAPYKAAPTASPPKEPTDKTVQPLTAWTWRDRLVSTNKIPRTLMAGAATGASQSPSKLLALSAVSGQSSTKQQTVSVSSQAELTPAPLSTSTPSPIVYPLRSTKKLASLAAVDLPTFPRR